MNLKPLVEDTCSGNVAAFTRARIGGGDDKVVRKPVEKKKGTGLKPGTLFDFVNGYKKR
jgi:hypothetical protein